MLDRVPDELVAGDTWQWTRELADYPAPTWTLTYYFENNVRKFNAVGTPSGTIHGFSIAAATTGGYASGRYKYLGRVTNGTQVFTVEEGWLDVALNPAADGVHDTRSWAVRTLEAIEATLENKASRDQLAMSVNGRSISTLRPSELMDWRTQLRAEVRAEQQAANGGKGRTIKARFARP